MTTHPYVVAITGASGAIYAVRLLSELVRAGKQIHLTVSIGLMSGLLTASNIESLIQCADKVMYRAKNAGRNRSLTHTDQFPGLAAANSAVG